ncbi:hypothetical protein AAZX31_09G097800 [Glycine max]
MSHYLFALNYFIYLHFGYAIQDSPMLFTFGMTYQFKVVFHIDRNIIEVPSLYHKQWAPDYPNYVVLDYNGNKHHIRVRKFNNRVYIVDGLKHFRRDMRIYEGVMITFAAPDKNWKFDIHFSPPLHAQVLPLDAVSYVNAGDNILLSLVFVGVVTFGSRINFFGRSLPESRQCGTRTTPLDYLSSESTSL